MPTSYTSLLGLALPVTGELSGTWGDTVNDYITKYVDASVAGTQTISGSQTAVTLTRANGGALSQAGSGLTGSSQYQIINCTGNPAGTLTVTIDVSTGSPALSNSTYSQTFAVINGTSTSQSVVVRATTTSGTSTGTTLVSGEKALIAWNGSDFIKVATSTVDGVSTIAFGTTGLTPSTATSGAVTVAGTLVAANGGTGQSSYTTGDLLYATGSTALSKLGIGTNGQILTSTGTAPQWSTLSGVAVTTFSAGTTGFTPSSATSGAITLAGTLATTNGGTGLTSFTANRVFYASSTSAIGQSANLTFDGTTLTAANFTDSSLTSGRVTYATTGGNLTDSANLLYSGTDLTVYGITVGRGAGAVASNTAVGASALAANTSGAFNTAFGQNALAANTTGTNTAVGRSALTNNTTSSGNTAVGFNCLFSNTGAANTAIGDSALTNNTAASNNTAVGYQAGYSNTTGTFNVAIGGLALYSNTTSSINTAVGYNSMYANNGGTENAAFGTSSLASNTTGNYNTALGRSALQTNTTASYNTAVGYQAGYSNTTGQYNTAIGALSLNSATTASSNSGFGTSALRTTTTGAYNTAVGQDALYFNTTASFNTAVGYQAGYSTTTAQTIDAFGYAALFSNTTGTLNTGIGAVSLYSNTTGSSNVAVGREALRSNTTASNNTAVGYQAGYSNQTGTRLTALGFQSLYNNTASDNTALGYYSLYSNSSGTFNLAVGGGDGATGSTLSNNTTGSNNTALGFQSLRSNTTASNNTAVGYQAGYSNTTGVGQTAVGIQALYSCTTGNRNTCIGDSAGTSITTGSRNTFIGGSNGVSGSSGSLVTTGSANSILGNYTGNQGGLDIRTANNYIVLSDGDGNPRQIIDPSGTAMLGTSAYIGFGGSLHLKSILAFVPDNTGAAGNRNWAIQTNGSQAGALDFVDSSANNTWPNNAYRVAVTSYGINLGGSTNTSGMGITFPATQVASSNANTLDDYEEGTWTPVLTATGSAPTVSYLTQEGKYTKVGNTVTIWWGIRINTISGGSGTVRISGLPFTAPAIASYANPAAIANAQVLTTGGTVPTIFYVESSASTMQGRVFNNADTPQGIGDYQAGSYIVAQLQYYIS